MGLKMNSHFPVLDGVLVGLCELSDEDIGEITQLMTARIAGFLWEVPYPYSEKNAQDFIDTSRRDFQVLKSVNFAIRYHKKFRDSNRLIGIISIKNIDWINKKANIGYWIGEKYWGRGIGTECVRLIINYAFSNLGLKELYAYVYLSNKASIRVLEKNGLKKKGEVNEYNKILDRYQKSTVYAIKNRADKSLN
jgi:RimJ/RimL family protein N-acetyltransferase